MRPLIRYQSRMMVASKANQHIIGPESDFGYLPQGGRRVDRRRFREQSHAPLVDSVLDQSHQCWRDSTEIGKFLEPLECFVGDEQFGSEEVCFDNLGPLEKHWSCDQVAF